MAAARAGLRTRKILREARKKPRGREGPKTEEERKRVARGERGLRLPCVVVGAWDDGVESTRLRERDGWEYVRLKKGESDLFLSFFT